ncbi:hypothetical protein B0H13DRAFT_1884846 [Mycena leptocephala]|nr:hypothetical protein B0H13DRAFT_1884846 [Mycena leptocephala]
MIPSKSLGPQTNPHRVWTVATKRSTLGKPSGGMARSWQIDIILLISRTEAEKRINIIACPDIDRPTPGWEVPKYYLHRPNRSKYKDYTHQPQPGEQGTKYYFYERERINSWFRFGWYRGACDPQQAVRSETPGHWYRNHDPFTIRVSKPIQVGVSKLRALNRDPFTIRVSKPIQFGVSKLPGAGIETPFKLGVSKLLGAGIETATHSMYGYPNPFKLGVSKLLGAGIAGVSKPTLHFYAPVSHLMTLIPRFPCVPIFAFGSALSKARLLRTLLPVIGYLLRILFCAIEVRFSCASVALPHGHQVPLSHLFLRIKIRVLVPVIEYRAAFAFYVIYRARSLPTSCARVAFIFGHGVFFDSPLSFSMATNLAQHNCGHDGRLRAGFKRRLCVKFFSIATQRSNKLTGNVQIRVEGPR